MIPAGTYPAVVVPVEVDGESTSIQFGPATDKSPFTAAVCFEVLSGPQAGQKITSFLYFGDNSIDRSVESLRICGFKGDDIDQFFGQRPENEVSIVVEHEEYDGKTRAKVKWINKPGGGGLVLQKRLAGADLKKMSARMKQRMKAAPVYEGKKAERQAPTSGPAASEEWNGMDQGDPDPTAGPARDTRVDDDLPF